MMTGWLHIPRVIKFYCLCLVLFCVTAAGAQQSVLTQHNNIGRTGWYNNETILNKQNVNANTFGKIFTRDVDDQIFAQPLVKLNMHIPGKGKKNVVFVATVNNTVYAFDADSANVTAPYWKVNYTPTGTRVVRNSDMTGACGIYHDFLSNIGIVSTPVIDTVTGTMYFLSRDVTTANVYEQYLHAVDFTTGAEKKGSPVMITATITGQGEGNVNGKITFDPQKQNQRAGLLLLNGVVYLAWASHCDWGPYHGWVMGYDAATLQQKYVYCTTPEGYWGGIWMSGGGPSADENGNIYVAVGNGSVGLNGNPASPLNRSESALKLSPDLKMKDFFTPKNFETLEGADLDFGVTQMLLIPNTNRGVVGVKDGRLFLVDRDNLGGYNGSSDNIVQAINLGSDAFLRSSMSYYGGTSKEYVYSWSENSLLRAIPYNRGTAKFDLDSIINSGIQGPTGNNGAVLSVSSNGSYDSTAILWASYGQDGDANSSLRPGILRAIDATDVTKELWNSRNDVNDVPGYYAKFNCPTVINGKVYLASFSNQLVVYGLRAKTLVIDNCDKTNLALNKPVMASSYDVGEDYSPEKVNDGLDYTRWLSKISDPQYITIDLGAVYPLCKIVVHWLAALASSFNVQVSYDNVNWADVADFTNNLIYDNIIPVAASARYVRVYGTERINPSRGYSIGEIEVYGGTAVEPGCKTPDSLYTTNTGETGTVLHWRNTGAKRYVVQYKPVSAANWLQRITGKDSIALNALSCNTPYLFRVQGACSDTDSSSFSLSSAFLTLACDVKCDPLPTRWSTQDIGNIGVSGAACYNSAAGTFELTGSGDDINYTADIFRFAYKSLVGDGEIIARVVDFAANNTYAKAGIMIRESLAPGSRNVFIAITNNDGASFQTRAKTDGYTTAANTVVSIHAPYWVKIKITGSVYTAYVSQDGLTWVQVGTPVAAGFGNGYPVYAGLAVTSHDNTKVAVTHIDNFSLGGVQPLKLISFTGNLTLNNTVALQWITTLETKTRYFIVERTSNFMNYTTVDTVYAENNADFTETYNTMDLNPVMGMNYYRLRIVDATGQTSYSPVVAVRYTNAKAPLMYPNPASSVVKIVPGTDGIREVTIYDIMGKKLLRVPNSTASETVTIPTAAYAGGLYFVEIRTEQLVYRQKLVIMN